MVNVLSRKKHNANANLTKLLPSFAYLMEDAIERNVCSPIRSPKIFSSRTTAYLKANNTTMAAANPTLMQNNSLFWPGSQSSSNVSYDAAIPEPSHVGEMHNSRINTYLVKIKRVNQKEKFIE